jgi:hypothetical protein
MTLAVSRRDSDLLHFFRAFACLVAGLLMLLITRGASGQETPLSEKTRETGQVTESSLETYYLRGEDGKLVPFFKIPFEEFDDLYRMKEGIKNTKPTRGYNFAEVKITGAAEKSFAELQIEIEILGLSDGWVNVPLRLNGLILKEADSDLDDKEFFLAADDKTGYELWFQSTPEKTHRFRLQGYRAIEIVTGRSQLNLKLPNAPYSQIDLKVPGIANEPSTSDDAILSEPKADGESTLLSALGPKGDFSLQWHSFEPNDVVVAPSVFSTAKIMARVEGQYNVRMQAEFNIESFGGNLDAVDVRLPGSVEFIPIEQVGVSMAPLRDIAANDAGGKQNTSVIRVSFDKPTAKPAPFIIFGNLKLAESQLLDMAGFEVIGAVRQVGTIDLLADKRWSIVPTNANVPRVPVTTSEGGAEPIYARYEFAQQPFQLKLRIAALPSRAKIKPVHQAKIDENSIDLRTQLDCQFEGPSPDALEVEIGDWQVNAVGPRQMVQDFKVSTDLPRVLTIQLTDFARQPFREPIIEIDFSRQIDATRLIAEFDLPIPQQASVEPAILAILPNDNIELQVENSELKGLQVYELPESIVSAANVSSPLGFRKTPLSDLAHFAARLTVQTRKIEVSSRLKIISHQSDPPENEAEKIAVQATHQLQIKFEPLRQLLLSIPKEAVEPRSDAEVLTLPLLFLDDEPVAYHLESGALAEGLAPSQQLIVVDAGRSLLGEHQLRMEFDLPAPESRYLDRKTFSVWQPMFMLAPAIATSPGLKPVACRLKSISVEESSNVEIIPDPEFWIVESEVRTANSRETLYRTEVEFTEVQVSFELDPMPYARQNVEIIEKLLFQTVLARSKRFERFSFRMETRDKPLNIILPNSSQLISAVVDNKEVKSRDGTTIVCDISDRSRGEHVVDIYYFMPQASSRARFVTCQVPTVEDLKMSKEIYWEVITLADEYYVGAESGLMPVLELNWQRGGLLARTAARDQLAIWVGVPPHPIPEDQAYHRYVFSSFGPIEPYKIYIANRRDIVLVGAALILLIGSLITIFPRIRHPLNLLGLIVVGTAISLRYPDLALLLMQISAVTLLVGTAIYLFQRALKRDDASLRHVYWSDANVSDVIDSPSMHVAVKSRSAISN